MRTTALLLVATLTLCPRAEARFINDFTQGSLNFSAGATPVTDVESGLDPSHTLGGVRQVTAVNNVSVRINDPAPTSPPRAIFDQGITLFDGEVDFDYLSQSTPFDLTENGDREFRVRLSGEFRAAYMLRASLILQMADGTGASKALGGDVTNNGQILTARVPFNTFEDLTAVSKITLQFEGAPAAASSPAFAVHSFETALPEPTTLVLRISRLASTGYRTAARGRFWHVRSRRQCGQHDAVRRPRSPRGLAYL